MDVDLSAVPSYSDVDRSPRLLNHVVHEVKGQNRNVAVPLNLGVLYLVMRNLQLAGERSIQSPHCLNTINSLFLQRVEISYVRSIEFARALDVAVPPAVQSLPQ